MSEQEEIQDSFDEPAPEILIPSVPGYQIEARVSHTTYGVIWEATQLSLERKVSLLTMQLDRLSNQDNIDWFEELSRVIARLNHRNFPQIIDISKTDEGLPYVVMEFNPGTSLHELIKRGPVPPQRAGKIVLQLADALDCAWKKSGFVHRNLKTSQISVGTDDSVQIQQFLSATIVRPGENALRHDEDSVIGTPNFMPPEQISCSTQIDFHADMYSVGAIFYSLITGIEPFSDTQDAMEILRGQMEGTIPAPSDINPKIPVQYSRVIQKMMAKNAHDRYVYWRDAMEDIERVIVGRDPYTPLGAEWEDVTSTIAPIQRKSASAKPAQAKVAAGRPVIRIGSAAASGSATAATQGTAPSTKKLSIVTVPSSSGSSSTSAPKSTSPRKEVPDFLRLVAFVIAVAGVVVTARESIKANNFPKGFSSTTADRAEVNSGNIVEQDNSTENTDYPDSAVVVNLDDDDDSDSGNYATYNAATQVASDQGSSGIQQYNANAPHANVAGYNQENANGTTAAISQAQTQPQTPKDPVLTEIVRDLYDWVMNKPFAETKKHAQFVLKRASEQYPDKKSDLLRIYQPFRMAVPWVDLVGMSFASSSAPRTISYRGRTREIRPVGYRSPNLICNFEVNGTLMKNRPISLEEMSTKELYDAISPVPESKHSREEILSRALLILREGSGEEFKEFVTHHKIVELRPFIPLSMSR